MIILEGPDNSGKTTLATSIQKWLGEDFVKIVKSPASVSKNWQVEWEHWALDHWNDEDNDGILYILDRTPEISEPIYATIYRGGNIRNSKFLENWIQFKEYPDLQILMCLQEGDVVEGFELTPDGSDTALQNDMLIMSYGLMYRLLSTALNEFNTPSLRFDQQFKVAPYNYIGSTNQFVEAYVKKHIEANPLRYHNMPDIVAPFMWPNDIQAKLEER